MRIGCDRSRRSARAGGFALIEVLVVMAMLGTILGLAMSYLVKGRMRLRQVTAMAHARDEMALAARRLRDEIRSSTGVRVSGQSITLTQTDGTTVTWQRIKDRLVRVTPRGKTVHQAHVKEMRLRLHSLSTGAHWVEVTLILDQPGRATRDTIYVAASPRVREASDGGEK